MLKGIIWEDVKERTAVWETDVWAKKQTEHEESELKAVVQRLLVILFCFSDL